MALNKAQLMDVPGGPGIIGAVKAGTNITISADGTISAAGGSAASLAGLGLATDASNTLKVAITESNLPPAAGTAAQQSIVGSLYWDNNLGALFIRYQDTGGTQWVQATPGGGGGGGAIPTGSVMLFSNSAAPTGWTQVTAAAYNDAALRIVTGAGGGTGGTINFTTFFSSTSTYTGAINITSGNVGDTTLTSDQLAAHTHTGGSATGDVQASGNPQRYYLQTTNTGPSGAAGSHTHSLVGAQANGNFTSNFGVKYVTLIACTKQ